MGRVPGALVLRWNLSAARIWRGGQLFLAGCQAGATVEMSLPMTAPTTPGMYFSDYRLKDNTGNPFGEVVYVRILVPSPAGVSLTPPLSQRDPLWASTRLGHPGSPKTIGEWGCLLTCFAMVANRYGRSLTPAQLNNSMVRKDGFLDGYLTKWNALGNVYTDIIYNGKVEASPGVLNRINDSLDAGNPVTILVDFTRDTPYTDNDQHWVLIVGRDGDDYRINDPGCYRLKKRHCETDTAVAGKPSGKSFVLPFSIAAQKRWPCRHRPQHRHQRRRRYRLRPNCWNAA
ncbi:MAG: C39 family peptidase [Chloroflexota bacterium]